MTEVIGEISLSLDGFVAGPGDSVENGLGGGGESLHEWVVALASWREAHGRDGGETGAEDDLFAASLARLGAVVMGRRMFDHGEGPWGDDPPFRKQVFVLTHRTRPPLVKGETTFNFVDGLDEALAGAREAAGGSDVSIASAHPIRQCLAAGELDELLLHVVPVFLGGGVALFEGMEPGGAGLRCVEAIASADSGVAHLRFRRG